MYHRVDVWAPPDRISQALTISPRQFSDEMAQLALRGLRAVSLDEYYERLRQNRPLDRVVLVTFDDGYADQYEYAVPILKRYGFGATFFVNSGTVGAPRHLTWSELRAMRDAGMSIEAHGIDHVDLAALPPSRQAREIDGCIASLRLNLREPVLGFAYPSGAFDAETMRLVRESGIAFGFTTDAARRWSDSPYDLARLRVENGLGTMQFDEMIDARQ